jgi:signal peptidase I
MPQSTAPAGLRLASAGATAILTLLCSATFWSLVPLAVGLRSEVVMSGSMSPRLNPGDVVVSAPVALEDLRPGMIISFTDPAHDKRNLIHRYIAPTADGKLQTKGDANTSPDSTPVSPAQVHGVARVRVPFVGLPAYWARTGRMLPLTGTGIALLALVVLATAGGPARTGSAAGPGAAGHLQCVRLLSSGDRGVLLGARWQRRRLHLMRNMPAGARGDGRPRSLRHLPPSDSRHVRKQLDTIPSFAGRAGRGRRSINAASRTNAP